MEKIGTYFRRVVNLKGTLAFERNALPSLIHIYTLDYQRQAYLISFKIGTGPPYCVSGEYGVYLNTNYYLLTLIEKLIIIYLNLLKH